MFWQKEFVEEAVRLQKALAIQAHGVSLDREEAQKREVAVGVVEAVEENSLLRSTRRRSSE